MEKSTYDSIFESESDHWWFVGRRKYISKLLKKHLNNAKNLELCEIGCGSGGNLKMLAMHGVVDAIEMEPNALQRATNRNIVGVRTTAVGWLPDNLPLQENYDVIVALDVIEHIDDDLESLKVLRERLKPGGSLLVTVPAYQWLWGPHDTANHHKRRYNRKLLLQQLKLAGFNVSFSSYFNTLLFPLSLIARFIQKLTGPHKAQFDELKIPHPAINSALKTIFGLESIFAGIISLPFGLSLVAVVKLNTDS